MASLNEKSRMLKQDYPYYRPVLNRMMLLTVLPAVFVFSGLGVWRYYACTASITGFFLLAGGFLLVIATGVYSVISLTRRLARKRLNIILLDQQLLKMSRLAASTKLTRDFLGHIKDVFFNIDSATAWGQSMIDQNNLPGFRDGLAQIKSESVRAHKSIDRLLAFTRPPGNRWIIQDIEVNQLIIDMLEVFANELNGRHIRIQQSFEKQLPMIRSNFSRLSQVIQNMFIVIVSDIEQEGDLNLKTAAKEDGVRIEMIYPSRDFDQNVLRRLSDPAYALQSQDPGPNLALTMYYVERINGQLSAEDTDSGLKFLITLPLRMNNASTHPPRSFLKGL